MWGKYPVKEPPVIVFTWNLPPPPPSNGKCVSEEAAGWGWGRCAWVTAFGGAPRGGQDVLGLGGKVGVLEQGAGSAPCLLPFSLWFSLSFSCSQN